jgi:hypothetical protein
MREWTVEGVGRRGGKRRVRVVAPDAARASSLAAERGIGAPHAVYSEAEEAGRRLRTADRVLTGAGGVAVVAGVLGAVVAMLRMSAAGGGAGLQTFIPEVNLALAGLALVGLGAALRMLAVIGEAASDGRR